MDALQGDAYASAEAGLVQQTQTDPDIKVYRNSRAEFHVARINGAWKVVSGSKVGPCGVDAFTGRVEESHPGEEVG